MSHTGDTTGTGAGNRTDKDFDVLFRQAQRRIVGKALGDRAAYSAAFDELFRQSRRRIVAQAYALTCDLDAAHSVAREAFCRTWEHFQRVRWFDDPESWTRRVMRNLVHDNWQRSARRDEWQEGKAQGAVANREESPGLPASRVDHLRSMSRPQLEVLILHELGGLTPAEVAAELSMSEPAIEVLLRRGREQLARRLSAANRVGSDTGAKSTPGEEVSFEEAGRLVRSLFAALAIEADGSWEATAHEVRAAVATRQAASRADSPRIASGGDPMRKHTFGQTPTGISEAETSAPADFVSDVPSRTDRTNEGEVAPVLGARGPIPFPVRLERALRSARFGFTGRTLEQHALYELASKAADGMCVAVVTGEPGIGKTTLCSVVAKELHGRGAVVLSGRCEEHRASPLAPWAQALGHLVAHCPPHALGALPPIASGVLRWLLPARADLLPSEGPVPAILDQESPNLLAEATIAVLAGAARLGQFRTTPRGSSPQVVLVLDDLQWVDPSSLDLLGRLFELAEGLAVVVFACFRPAQSAQPFGSLSEVLGRHPQRCERIDLGPLAENDVAALLESAATSKLKVGASGLARNVGREIGGNPFFVCEVARRIVELGRRLPDDSGGAQSSDIEALANMAVSATLNEWAIERVARLGDRALDVISTAAVIGEEFDLSVLEGASEAQITTDSLLDLLSGAVDAGILAEVTSRPGSWRFCHSLIRQVLYDELDPTRRRVLHHRVARALEACQAPTRERMAELAHQWIAAVDPVEATTAARYAKLAGDAALETLAPLDAIRWYGRALALSPEEECRERCELLIALGDAQRRAGQPDERDTLVSAAFMAKRIGARDLLVSAVLALKSGHRSVFAPDSVRYELVKAAYLTVEDRFGSEGLRLAAALAEEEAASGDWRKAQAFAVETVRAARATGDDGLFLQVYSIVYPLTFDPDRFADRLAETSDAVGAARRIGDPRMLVNALDARLISVMEAGDIAEADRCRAEAALAAASSRLPYVRWRHLEMLSGRLLIDGRLADAELRAQEAFEFGRRYGFSNVDVARRAKLVGIRAAQGDHEEMIEGAESLRTWLGQSPLWPVARVALTRSYCESGRFAEARELFAEDWAFRFSDLRRDMLWMEAMANCADTACDLEDFEAAQYLFGVLLPYADRFVYNLVRFGGSVARCVGRLAAALGRFDEAEDLLERALRAHDAMPAPYWGARTRLDLAEVLARVDGARTGSERVRQLVGEAAQIAGELGFKSLAARAASILLA